jgi:hypothetical protein
MAVRDRICLVGVLVANCNDHIRKIDNDGNLFITEQEAESYYRSITPSTEKDQ